MRDGTPFADASSRSDTGCGMRRTFPRPHDTTGDQPSLPAGHVFRARVCHLVAALGAALAPCVRSRRPADASLPPRTGRTAGRSPQPSWCPPPRLAWRARLISFGAWACGEDGSLGRCRAPCSVGFAGVGGRWSIAGQRGARITHRRRRDYASYRSCRRRLSRLQRGVVQVTRGRGGLERVRPPATASPPFRARGLASTHARLGAVARATLPLSARLHQHERGRRRRLAFSLVTGAVLLTWLYNGSKGSLLVVALFHAAMDVVFTSAISSPLVVNIAGALSQRAESSS